MDWARKLNSATARFKINQTYPSLNRSTSYRDYITFSLPEAVFGISVDFEIISKYTYKTYI